MANEVLNPCVICIGDRRNAVFPAIVRSEKIPTPVLIVKRGICNNKISLEILMRICKEEGLLREGWRERDYMFQGAANDMDMTCNAQAFINISRKRLCYGCASEETRFAWQLVIGALKEVDPILAEKCVPECLYRGFCPEKKRSCGYVNSPGFQKRLEEYRNME